MQVQLGYFPTNRALAPLLLSWESLGQKQPAGTVQTGAFSRSQGQDDTPLERAHLPALSCILRQGPGSYLQTEPLRLDCCCWLLCL